MSGPRLTGRRVLVVGAGTQPSDEPDPPVGNGRAIAVLAVREGASVVCAERDKAAAEETAAWIEREGGTSAVAVCNVTVADPHVVVCARRAGQRIVTSAPEDLARLDPDLELVVV